MKSTLCLTALLCFILAGCKNQSEKKYPDPNDWSTSSSEIWPLNGDTINRTDVKGRKQGPWKYFSYGAGKMVEEGDYKDNRKNGWWKYYDSSGKLMRKVYFTNDMAR